MMSNFLRNKKIDEVTFQIFNDCLLDKEISIDKILERSDRQGTSDITQAFLTEFFIVFRVKGVRSRKNRRCENGAFCLSLKFHSLFHTIWSIIKEKPLSQEEKISDCIGTHEDCELLCCYGNASRILDHPIFTRELLKSITDRLWSLVRDYFPFASLTQELNIKPFGGECDCLMEIPLFARTINHLLERCAQRRGRESDSCESIGLPPTGIMSETDNETSDSEDNNEPEPKSISHTPEPNS
jgi:hypothetical protein